MRSCGHSFHDVKGVHGFMCLHCRQHQEVTEASSLYSSQRKHDTNIVSYSDDAYSRAKTPTSTSAANQCLEPLLPSMFAQGRVASL